MNGPNRHRISVIALAMQTSRVQAHCGEPIAVAISNIPLYILLGTAFRVHWYFGPSNEQC